MPRQERRVLARRERWRYRGDAAMAGAAGMGRAGSRQPDRMANGASALLWAVRPQGWRHDGPDFRSAVAFYPDCRISAGLGWSARMPTLLLIGAKDDVSSPAACRQMWKAPAAAARLARIEIYPGAAHDFDAPSCRCMRSPATPIPACRSAAISHRRGRPRGFAKARRGVAGK